MQLRHDQLANHLSKSGGALKPLYTLHGDEALLVQEAGDAIRAAAKAAGYTERQVHTVSGAYFDWSSLLGAASEMSLFGDRQFIDIRIPSGKPGKEGSQALQQYCETAAGNDGVITLVTLPRLDKTQLSSAWFTALDGVGVSVRCDPIERQQLPLWIAQRLAAQGQQVEPGEAGQRTLAFFADRVEGNLLAARQEIDKLALLHPPGELDLAALQAAVADVARFDVFQLNAAWLAGETARVTRMLAGLEAEGEAPVLALWSVAEELRSLIRIRIGLRDGKPMAQLLRENRMWGERQRLAEPALRRLGQARLQAALSECAAIDRAIKGAGPGEPWRRLEALLVGLCRTN